MEQEQSTTSCTRIVSVITAGIMPKDETEIVIALNESVNLQLPRIILVHNTREKSGKVVF